MGPFPFSPDAFNRLNSPLPNMPKGQPYMSERISKPQKDVFQKKAASVYVNHDGSIKTTHRAVVTFSGKIRLSGKNGGLQIGYLDPNGNYRLIDGRTGNIFSDQDVNISERDLKKRNNSLTTRLREVKKNRALQGSEIPILRQHLTARGINGQGVKIGILDPYLPSGHIRKHSMQVSDIIQNPIWGIAPKAQVIDSGFPYPKFLDLKQDDFEALQMGLIDEISEMYRETAKQINRVVDQKDPGLRVLNLSCGQDKAGICESISRRVNAKDSNGRYVFPNIRASVLGSANTLDKEQRAIVNFVNRLLDNQPRIEEARRRYVEATRHAAKSGITLVVAAGNDHDAPFNMKPGDEMKMMAKSPYVISVAAANTRQMPGNRKAYAIAPFSSRGDGHTWNPTIAAPGAEMIVQKLDKTPRSIDGTSFAAPYICGVIAMMLQQNSNLTFEQIKANLQKTAVQLPGYSTAEQGAGVVNPLAAVHEALQMKRNNGLFGKMKSWLFAIPNKILGWISAK